MGKEESANKNKKRLEKEAAEKAAAEEAAKKKEEEAKLAAEKEAAAKAEKQDAKKAKEAAKKNKRVVRGAAKDANYFAEGTASAAQIDGVLNDVDAVIAKIDNEELAELTAKLNGKTGAKEIKDIFAAEVARLKSAGKAKDGDFKTL